MSESSDKLIAVSKRQPVQRRRRIRQVPKARQKPVPKPQQEAKKTENIALTRVKNTVKNNNPATVRTGTQKAQPQLVMPKAVKPIPRGKTAVTQPTKGIRTVRIPKQSSLSHRQSSKKTRLKPMARTVLYVLRMLIVGVGLGAIVGTILSILDPASRMTTTSPSQTNVNQAANNPVNSGGLYLSQEIIPLKTSIQNLAATNPNLIPGVFVVDLDTGAYVDINSNAIFPAASTIKIPILVAFFQDVDAGKVRLDEMLTMEKEMMVGGSGNLRTQPAGSQYTALDVATKMITISDNTATNMLIQRLGGQEVLNARFRSWGLINTVIRNPLPDLEGTNTTTPKELGDLIAKVNQGSLVSMRSRDAMLDIMRQTERDTLIPAGLGEGARSYHKTGDIGSMLGDAGLIDIPTGKRYIAAVMVQRPHNDPKAETLISSISKLAYQFFSQAAVTPRIPTSNPSTNNFQQPNQPLIPPQAINPTAPNGLIQNTTTGTNQTPVITPQNYR
ncbi:MAG: serine hydrolase [Nostocales cyanobacterium]|nr:MAG: serine hydrolase [Nostocales cyanobacterium]TAF06599.1 MAG: serine hydrolase [Nostocales cyanobacterium]